MRRGRTGNWTAAAIGSTLRVSMRCLALVAAGCCLLSASLADAHTSVGSSGGGSSDPDADCLRWEAVPISPADGAAADAAVDAAVDGSVDGGDAGSSDAGASTIAVKLVCVEHATMFGCACTLGAGSAPWTSAIVPASLLVAGALAAAFRRGRRRRPGAEETSA
jgi:MYXO-CTERM domain-containing protein